MQAVSWKRVVRSRLLARTLRLGLCIPQPGTASEPSWQSNACEIAASSALPDAKDALAAPSEPAEWNLTRQSIAQAVRADARRPSLAYTRLRGRSSVSSPRPAPLTVAPWRWPSAPRPATTLSPAPGGVLALRPDRGSDRRRSGAAFAAPSSPQTAHRWPPEASCRLRVRSQRPAGTDSALS